LQLILAENLPLRKRLSDWHLKWPPTMSSCTENTEKIQRLKNIKGLQSMIIQIEKKPEIVKTQKKDGHINQTRNLKIRPHHSSFLLLNKKRGPKAILLIISQT